MKSGLVLVGGNVHHPVAGIIFCVCWCGVGMCDCHGLEVVVPVGKCF